MGMLTVLPTAKMQSSKYSLQCGNYSKYQRRKYDPVVPNIGCYITAWVAVIEKSDCFLVE